MRWADRHPSLITQVYLAGGPCLTDDAITGVKKELVAEVSDGGALRFDIALAAEGAAG